MSLATLFDYDALDVETRVVVQQKTGEIKDRVRRSRQDILEIGERLVEIKDRLGHGSFGRWLEAEFGWSDRFAQDLMNVAKVFKSELNSDLDITPTALRSLAAPSVPEPARKEAIETARSGNHVGTKEAAAIVEKHKPAVREPIPDLFTSEDNRGQDATESQPADADEPADDEPEEEEDTEDEEEPKVARAEMQQGSPRGEDVEPDDFQLSSVDEDENLPLTDEDRARNWISHLDRLKDGIDILTRSLRLNNGIVKLASKQPKATTRIAISKLAELKKAADGLIEELRRAV